MAYYSISTPNMKRAGTANVSLYESVDSPYNFLGKDIVHLFQSHVPFSLLFTRYVCEDENPFRVIMLSPDFSMNSTLSYKEFEMVVRDRPLHQHDTYELMYILSGELFQRIENTRHKYIENSCCLINRSIRHAEEYNTNFHSVNLSLSRDFLLTLLEEGEQNYFRAEKSHVPTDLFRFLQGEFQKNGASEKKYIDFTPRASVSTIKGNIHYLFDQMTTLILNPGPGTSLMLRAIIYRIFYYLNNTSYYDTTPMQLGTPTESRLFSQITELMEQTDGRISRTRLSEELNYSGNYLNRVVQKYSGMNIFEYGNSYTMQKASQLLTSSEKSISDIIFELGFTDRTHFYKLFEKEFGMTPRAYRLQNTGEHGLS